MGGSVSPFMFRDGMFRSLLVEEGDTEQVALCVNGRYSAFAFTIKREAVDATKAALTEKAAGAKATVGTTDFRIARGPGSYSSYSAKSTSWTTAGSRVVVLEGVGLPWDAAWVVYMSPDLPTELGRTHREMIEEQERARIQQEERAKREALDKLE